MNEARTNPLSLTAGTSCVTWATLTQLRLQFNDQIWTPLDGIGITDGRKYGEKPWQEEIDGLPAIKSFFHGRVTVTDGVATAPTAADIDWVLTPCEFLTRCNDTATWSYLTASTHTWVAHLTDPCHGCGVLLPSGAAGVVDMTLELNCLKDSPQTLYEGFYKAGGWSATTTDYCNIGFQWYNVIGGIFEKIVGGLPAEIEVSPEDDDTICYQTGNLCKDSCVLPWTAYYEYVRDVEGSEDGSYIMALKYVDVGIDPHGDEGKITGIATTQISGGHPGDIKNRIIDNIDNWHYIGCDVCDKCGPDTAPGTTCASTSHKSYNCSTPIVWNDIRKLFAVTNDPTCARCTEVFSGRICACPWNELSSVMAFLFEHCCIGDEEACPCDCTPGACCDGYGPDATCTILSEADCAELPGFFKGPGTVCDPNPCPEEMGACCDGETCTLEFAADCTDPRVFKGIGTSCDPNPCIPTGACCKDGDCTIKTAAACAGIGGTYGGNGTSCDPNPCPPVGACCQDAVCTIKTAADCAGVGGVYRGNGTSCDPNPCQVGACCVSPDPCVEVSSVNCAALGGLYMGDGSTCTPDPC